MHIIMPILLLLSFPLLGFIFYDLIKRTHRTRLIILSTIALVFIGLLTWYLIPTKYELPDSGDLSFYINYDYANKHIQLTDSMQKEELKRLVEELKVEREFLGSNRDTFLNPKEYVYLVITGKDQETNEPFLLGLHLTLNDGGLTYGYGHCFDNNYSNIKNPQRLIAYIRSMLAVS
jgi:hypothetical protein